MNDTFKLKKEGKSSYDILMRETSDVMQDLAMAYGERSCLEYCISTLDKLKSFPNKKILTQVFRLYGTDIIERDLAHYIIAGVINKDAQKGIFETKN